MHRRTIVVREPWQRELFGTRSAANGRGGLHYLYGEPRLRDDDGSRETVRSGSYNDHVGRTHLEPGSLR